MAGSKSNYLQLKLLDTVLGGPQFTLPSPSVHIALSLGAFSATSTGSAFAGGGEVTAGGYTRVAVTNDSTRWPAASSSAKANGAVFTFPSATANWGTVLSFYICDSATGGNVLYGADLTTSRTINSGDTASFAVGSITLTEN